jgi:CYTH domain-containing protein
LRVIGNEGSFEQKLKKLLAELCVVLGIPEPLEIERKFLVDKNVPLERLGAYQVVDIEQFYLLSSNPEEELRFRKRTQRGESTYFRTKKRPGPDQESRFETESFITASDYEFGKQFMLPGSHFVRKQRFCFVYENQYFELDRFSEPALDYCLLEIELASTQEAIQLPPFLTIEREVTGDKAYGNRALALA